MSDWLNNRRDLTVGEIKDLVTSTVPGDDDASGAHPSPSPAGILLTVEPWEVEHGDILAGLRTPIASILQDDRGVWYYGDDHGITIAKRPHWSKVQILRGNPCEDCNPYDIERPRHLEVVR